MNTETEKSTTGDRRIIILRADDTRLEYTDTPKKRDSDLLNERINTIQNACRELFQRIEQLENKFLDHNSQLESIKKTIKILDEEIVDIKKDSD
ncbi:Autophagy protein Apg6 [Orpheovirus IHUMI-LCC2]|uniref:Autophagy protein Apg6 n=1 Tax=Orpheovirus IHUMI-LCC2 TaxID=2023057 RepID=A0A2I2L4C1_9VIRU|nr:Autophagy protein Apg6 [Orpheovirus IHUMI-LCC2]SNW62378.1 Autophagy protein Apg6 [Orpheovirus IHUMI-LCC2]